MVCFFLPFFFSFLINNGLNLRWHISHIDVMYYNIRAVHSQLEIILHSVILIHTLG